MGWKQDALTVAAFHPNVRLVLHPDSVPIVDGSRNVAAVGFRCNARVRMSLYGDSLLVAIPVSWSS